MTTEQVNDVVNVFKKEITNLLVVIQGMDQRIRKIEAMLVQALPIRQKKDVELIKQSASVPSSPAIPLRSKRGSRKGSSSNITISPLSKDQQADIKKLLSQETVTLHFMNNYKKIAILTLEKQNTILQVKQMLQQELKQDNIMPDIQNITFSSERPLVCICLYFFSKFKLTFYFLYYFQNLEPKKCYSFNK